MVKRLPLAKFRFVIAEVVRNAERGQATILTSYNRDVAAVVPVEMLPNSPEEESIQRTESKQLGENEPPTSSPSRADER